MEFNLFYIHCPPQPCEIQAFNCKVTSLAGDRISLIHNNSKESCKNLSCLVKKVFLEACTRTIHAD